MSKVQSSAVASYCYNAATMDLSIVYTNGRGAYVYKGVPQILVNDFDKAESKGRFVNEFIKPRFTVVSVQ